MSLNLPTVTLVCADCVNLAGAIMALERSKALCNFGAVKLFTSLETDYPHRVTINPLTTKQDYSAFMLKRVCDLVETPHMLTVQWDGWVLHPEMWDPAWLGYDYVAPLFTQDRVIGPRSVGCGGFSLRSTALMAAVSSLLPPWDGVSGSLSATWGHEDGVVALNLRSQLEASGFKFAPPVEASKFCQAGNLDPLHFVPRPFGFHGWWANIDREAGVISLPWRWPAPEELRKLHEGYRRFSVTCERGA